MSPALKLDLAAAVDQLRRSTVEVRGRGPGAGSGLIWEPGLIITNAHVARESRARVLLSSGEPFDAEVISRDPRRDLAALRVNSRDLPVASVGDSEALRVGELVIAVGNPLGFTGAAATGIIHERTRDWVRADVRLAPGNSGGPLANASGEVIGINSMIANGLALAVPSRAVKRFLHPPRRIGVTLRPVTGGLLVLSVEPRRAAAKAGVMAGDLLTGFDDPESLAETLHAASVSLDVTRGGARIRLVVHPAEAAAA